LFFRRSLFSTIVLSNRPPPTAPYTLSLHDALPISPAGTCQRGPISILDVITQDLPGRLDVPVPVSGVARESRLKLFLAEPYLPTDRKSTRLNSSHVKISYAVFCLKKKK